VIETGAKKGICLLLVLLIALVLPQMEGENSSQLTGIEGTITLSPAHGGPTRKDEPDAAPFPNTAFDVLQETVTVTSFTTDAAGHFRVSLAPGHYSIKLHNQQARWPRCGPFEIEVTTEGFKTVQLGCDSGMR
jgi:hypothetical protein